MRHEREVLKHHAHAMTPELDQLLRRHGEEIATIEQDFARRRFDEARQTAHQRRLARARQAHDDDDLAGTDIDADVGDGSDQTGATNLLRRGRCGARPQETARPFSIELPDGAALSLET